MMNIRLLIPPFPVVLLILVVTFAGIGCGQPVPPTGGPRDSLPPVMVRATPGDSTTNFTGNRITIEFNEYIALDNPFEKLVFNPVPKVAPQAEGRLRTVTVRIKDTLEPNTTYSIDFGTAIKDINENNILRNFKYVFSTGSTIDNGTLNGKVFLAESGKTDSTLIVVLHRNLDDSAVAKERPRYTTKLNKEGEFRFEYLAPGAYNIFALKDADGGKKYDQKSEYIGFLEKPVQASQNEPVFLYAFTEEPEEEESRKKSGDQKAAPRNKDDKRLKFTSNLDGGRLDILGDLSLKFETPLAKWDSSKLIFADENFQSIPAFTIRQDTIPTTLILKHNWTPDKKYNLILQKDFASDSAGNTITRTDTIAFQAKRESDYGGLRVNITSLDTSKHPVLILYLNDKIELVQPLTTSRLQYRLFRPGEYEVRILYDRNQNLKWDTGNYWQKMQPEKIVTRQQKLNIRANWDNEIEINLSELAN